MDNRTIYLVRHGKIQLADDQRRFIGQIDLPLASEGVSQALSLQRVLARADINAVYCSDLIRARQTAELAVGQRSIGINPRRDLREISMGEWEGCTFADIARLFPHKFKDRGTDIGYYRVPGGESFADCSRRIIAAFSDIITSSTGNILIVSHAGANRALLCHLLGMPLANLFRLAQDYGCLNVLQANKTTYRVKLINFPVVKKSAKGGEFYV